MAREDTSAPSSTIWLPYRFPGTLTNHASSTKSKLAAGCNTCSRTHRLSIQFPTTRPSHLQAPIPPLAAQHPTTTPTSVWDIACLRICILAHSPPPTTLETTTPRAQVSL